MHRSYWKRYHDQDNPNQAKLVLYATTRQPGAIPALSALANQLFDMTWAANKHAIQALPAATKRRFAALVQATGKATPLEWELPTEIVERHYDEPRRGHLYSDEDKLFHTKLNGWEAELLTEETGRVDFVGWLRIFRGASGRFASRTSWQARNRSIPTLSSSERRGRGLSSTFLSRTMTPARTRGRRQRDLQPSRTSTAWSSGASLLRESGIAPGSSLT